MRLSFIIAFSLIHYSAMIFSSQKEPFYEYSLQVKSIPKTENCAMLILSLTNNKTKSILEQHNPFYKKQKDLDSTPLLFQITDSPQETYQMQQILPRAICYLTDIKTGRIKKYNYDIHTRVVDFDEKDLPIDNCN